MIFTGEVERPYSFFAFERVYQEFADRIKDLGEFRSIRNIYDDLYYYREIVKLYRLENPGDIVTERQFNVCNKILEYFGENKVDSGKYDNNRDQYIRWQKSRGDAIEIKNKNFEKWMSVLNEKFEKIFDI